LVDEKILLHGLILQITYIYLGDLVVTLVLTVYFCLSIFTVVGRFNDLWKFDGTYWIWISGSNVTNQPGIYGEKNNANEANVPDVRNCSFSWIDSSDYLYLF